MSHCLEGHVHLTASVENIAAVAESVANTLPSTANVIAPVTYFLVPQIEAHGLHNIWFQQDGATCHTACSTMDLLGHHFGEQLVSRFGPVNHTFGLFSLGLRKSKSLCG
uniref:Putative LOC101238983 [Hydra vulgaris] n=1 Tax=Lepeophtheirus salmonis TaxID=72036 RepID=A0A0K2TJQ2_LEPSM